MKVSNGEQLKQDLALRQALLEILPDLAGCQVHGLTQRGGGDPNHAHLIERVELAVVAGQTADDRVGNFAFLHGNSFLSLAITILPTHNRIVKFFYKFFGKS